MLKNEIAIHVFDSFNNVCIDKFSTVGKCRERIGVFFDAHPFRHATKGSGVVNIVAGSEVGKRPFSPGILPAVYR